MSEINPLNTANSLDDAHETVPTEPLEMDIERQSVLPAIEIEEEQKGKIINLATLKYHVYYYNVEKRSGPYVILLLMVCLILAKKKRTRRKKHKASNKQNQGNLLEMEDTDPKIDKLSVKSDAGHKISETSKGVNNKNRQKRERRPFQVQSPPCNSKAMAKEKLFDPISKQYVQPKNTLKSSEKNKQSKGPTINGYSNQNNPNTAKKNNQNNDKHSFPPHYINEMVERGLKRGLLLEGTLRINPKSYEDAFISNDVYNEPDIYIGGIMSRNRALNGDEVIVDLLPESEWRVNNELIDEYLKENNLDDLPSTAPEPVGQDDNEMVIKFKRLGVRFNRPIEIPAEHTPTLVENANSGSSRDDILNVVESGSDVSSSLIIENRELDINEDISSAKFNTKGKYVPLEELEEAEFDGNGSYDSPANHVSEDESLDSSDDVDIVIDEIVEINHSPPKEEQRSSDLCNSSVSVSNVTSHDEGTNEKVNRRTRRKRGSRKHKTKNMGKYNNA